MSKDEEVKGASDVAPAANPLSKLEAAELNVVLAPIFTYLTTLQAPGANAETVVAGFEALKLELVAQLPLIESIGINEVASDAQARLAAWQASLANGTAAV